MVAPLQSLLQTFTARAVADAALFRPGQTLEAVVIGRGTDGLTALRIGDVVISAQLPKQLPPGTVLQLQVKSGGPAPQLVITAPPQIPVAASANLPIPSLAPLPTVIVPQIVGSLPHGTGPLGAPAPTAAAASTVVAAALPQQAGPAPAQQGSGITAQAPAPGAPSATALAQPTAPSPLVPSASVAPSQPQNPRWPGQGAAVPSPPSTPQVAPPPILANLTPAAPTTPVPAPSVGPIAESGQAVTPPSASSTAPVPQVAGLPQPAPSPILTSTVAPASAIEQPALPGPLTPAIPPSTLPSGVAAEPGAAVPPPNAAAAQSVAPPVATVASGQSRPSSPNTPFPPGPVTAAASFASQAEPATASVVQPAQSPAPVPGQVPVSPPVAQSRVPNAPPPPTVTVTPAAQPLSPASAPPSLVSAGVPGPSGSATSAAVEEQTAANPLLVAQNTRVPALPAAFGLRPPAAPMVAPPTQAAAPPPGARPLPATPQAALTQMVPEAMSRQNALAPLLLSLATLANRPAAVPEPVMRAALQVLAQRVPVPAAGPTADALKLAIERSGVFLEAGLARAGPPAADLKSALLTLRTTLATWFGGTPPPVSAVRQVAPPLKGMPPRAELPAAPPLPDAPAEAARLLHHQADAAISRLKLMQFASLPDADPARPAAPELRMEVPFLIGHELAMAQFQILRDAPRKRPDGKRGWTMRFAMNFSATGEVGAEIGLLGRSVSVALWAAEAETAARLEAALPELAPALSALGLEPGTIRLRSAPPTPEASPSGRYLDSRR